LALIQPVQRTPQIILSRFFLKHIDTKITETRDEPILVAKFGDVALPLATFYRRKDGQCSYVQIGSEIQDDNFHVLASDDRTGRHVIIEAIRDLLDPKYKSVDRRRKSEQVEPFEENEKLKSALVKLLDFEVDQNRDKLAAGFEAQLVRKSFESFDPETWRGLVVVNENGENYEGRYTLRTLIERARLPDSRTAQLVLAKPIDGPDQDLAHIMAITREQVALPVATLNATTGQIRFENSELEARTQRRQDIVYKFLSILRGNPLVSHSRIQFMESDESHQVPQKDKRSRVKEKLANMLDLDNRVSDGLNRVVDGLRITESLRRDSGVIDGLRIAYPISRIDRLITDCFEAYDNVCPIISRDEVPAISLNRGEYELRGEVHNKLAAYLKNPDDQPNPYPHSRLLRLAVRRLDAERQAKLDVLNQFNVCTQLTNILGPTTAIDEALVEQIFTMAKSSNVHRGVIKKVNLESAIADIDFKIEISCRGSNYQITASRKPTAMEDEALRISPTFSFGYDITRPIGEQLNGTRDHIQEAIYYFRQLKPVKPQEATK
jgi:hypothetical protein